MKNDKKPSPLKTPMKDLKPEDVKSLERPLGTSDRPYPMWGSQRIEHNGRADLEQVLSVIADDTYPMKVFSERPYKEVIAMAYCDMPTPSMLPLFFDGLERRKPDSTNRTQMMIGDPGAGKSFLGALQGRLRSKEPVEVLDCGGKNMRELLFEMVLDFGAGDALPKSIDKRLQAGTLEPMSMALLKALPSEVVSIEDGTVKSIDWNGLKAINNDKVEAAFETLKKVSKIEGLDNAGGNALGMNSQYGPLIRKFLAGEEIVLDEYNKSREGTDDNLQTVWQFCIGELKECTVENPLKNKDATAGPSEFTFRREDMKPGFFVTLTGNKKEDGVTTRSLNKSVYSRLSPQTLPDPDVIDWQHRICQMMVGLPVSTLYTTFKEQADKDPDQFGEWLLWLRRTKAEVEGGKVPELQETLLQNWKNVVNSSEKLARFYDKWQKMTDAEKITSNGNPDLVEEVDDEYSKKEGIDFRKIKQHLEEAIPIRPRMLKEDAPRALDLKAWEKVPSLGEPVVENSSLNFGTRLTEFLERMVYEKSGAVGKPKLYNKLQKAMQEFALRDITLQEAARSKQRSVEEDLNISAFNDRDLTKQAKMARNVFCDFLRQSNPEIKATNDEIVTPKTFVDALTAISKAETAKSNELFVANRDPESLYAGHPLVSAIIKDAATYVAAKKEIDFGLNDLVHHDDFLASLAMPTVGAKNLTAVWDQNLRPLMTNRQEAANANTPPAAAAGAGTPGPVMDLDESLYIAENRSDKKIATTSLQVLWTDEQGERPVSIHIVRNEARNKTLVVSEKAPSKLLSAFKEAGVIHVDRNDANAVTKVEQALAEITRGLTPSVKERLVDAFKYRNDADSSPALKGKEPKLTELLVDGNVEMMYPKYVIKNDKKKAAGM